MEMHGTMLNRKLHNLVVRCLSSFGMSAMYMLNTVSFLAIIWVHKDLSLTFDEVFIKDPPLWSINIMNGTNMWFNDMYVNATAVNVLYGTFDTMDANNIKLTNMVYQKGDDCIAIKPRSYNIFVQNVILLSWGEESES
jgi:hypothetical protein